MNRGYAAQTQHLGVGMRIRPAVRAFIHLRNMFALTLPTASAVLIQSTSAQKEPCVI